MATSTLSYGVPPPPSRGTPPERHRAPSTEDRPTLHTTPTESPPNHADASSAQPPPWSPPSALIAVAHSSSPHSATPSNHHRRQSTPSLLRIPPQAQLPADEPPTQAPPSFRAPAGHTRPSPHLVAPSSHTGRRPGASSPIPSATPSRAGELRRRHLHAHPLIPAAEPAAPRCPAQVYRRPARSLSSSCHPTGSNRAWPTPFRHFRHLQTPSPQMLRHTEPSSGVLTHRAPPSSLSPEPSPPIRAPYLGDQEPPAASPIMADRRNPPTRFPPGRCASPSPTISYLNHAQPPLPAERNLPPFPSSPPHQASIPSAHRAPPQSTPFSNQTLHCNHHASSRQWNSPPHSLAFHPLPLRVPRTTAANVPLWSHVGVVHLV